MRLFALFFFLLSLNSEAAPLRCFNLFTNAKPGSAAYLAEVIDSVNSENNGFLYSSSLREKLNPRFEEMSFSKRTRARIHSYRLRWQLMSALSPEHWDAYDFDFLSYKLEQLTFLADASALEEMPRADRVLYLQARRSLLVYGLKNFFFGESPTTDSRFWKVYHFVTIPLKDKYFRWTYAYMFMPKLVGAILPVDLALKIAWEGLEKNRELLRPYQQHAQFKSYFNVFSSTYNWALVAAIFVGVPTYGVYKYQDLKEKGAVAALKVLGPMEQSSRVMAEKDYHAEAEEKDLKNFIIQFKLDTGKEPTADELAMFKKLKGS